MPMQRRRFDDKTECLVFGLDEAAGFLGVTVDEVRALHAAGELEGFQLFNRYRIFRDSARKYLERRKKREATPPAA